MTREEMLERLKNGEDPLEVSLKKWEDIRDTIRDINIGTSNCALCETHLHFSSMEHCSECPVKEQARMAGCGNTPFKDAAHEKDVFFEAVVREIVFLKSLRKE